MLPFNQRGYIPFFLLFAVIMISGFIMYAATDGRLFLGQTNLNPDYTPILVIKNNRIATDTGRFQVIPPLTSPSSTISALIAKNASDSANPSPSPELSGEAGPAGDIIHTPRGDFIVQVVTLPISATMVTDTASDADCPRDCPTFALAEFVTKNGGVAGITGTFNCPSDYEDCKDKKESFDFSVYNSRLGKWINESNLSWNDRSMIYQDGGGYHYQQDVKNFSGSVKAGIVNFPGILNNGQVTVNPNGLPEKQRSKGTKSGVGYGKDNIYLVVAYDADMEDFAEIFKVLGALNALNMDGGGGAALYHNGGYKAGPGRNLPNAIIFKWIPPFVRSAHNKAGPGRNLPNAIIFK